MPGLLAQLPVFFDNLTIILGIEATEQFTGRLSTTLIDMQPGPGKDATVQLMNTGHDPVMLTLTTQGLPNGVTTAFGQGDDGMDARILVDGTQVYAQGLARFSSATYSFQFPIP